jgi:predicted nucleic acid-binding protein
MLVGTHLVSGKQAHDAHLVAVMLVYAVTDILTFNIADFRRYPGITVLDPAQF